jgi:hypothetical protein
MIIKLQANIREYRESCNSDFIKKKKKNSKKIITEKEINHGDGSHVIHLNFASFFFLSVSIIYSINCGGFIKGHYIGVETKGR